MAEPDPTCIGRVRHVLGASVTVELDRDLAGIAPLWEGRLQPVGQVGTLVRLPQGPVTLLATVTLVGISELSGPVPPALTIQLGDRWLQAQLVGEITLGRFQRGVSTYPGLDDPVHFATVSDLSAVHPPAGPDRVRIGVLAAASEVEIALHAARLVTRHTAVVGSTGSGKTSAVANLLQQLVAGGWSSANVVVIDPHGEYASAFPDVASVRSVVADDGDAALRVPYWALPSDDVLQVLAGSGGIRSKFAEIVTDGRRRYAAEHNWVELDPSSITADTPLPFDIKDAWYRLDYENKATYERNNGGGKVCVTDPGDPSTLVPAKFEPYAQGGAAPFKGPSFGTSGSAPDAIRRRLLDDRFRFLLEPSGHNAEFDPLIEVLSEWLGGAAPISVLDFSGVPSEAADVAIGVVLQLLFEVATRSHVTGIGRAGPVLVVLEEAHRYLSEEVTSARLARTVVNRIAREGRKYGMGIMLVTQRPSELPATALAQAGTIVALRLTNGSDQGVVKAALPDSIAGLADGLPALRTGEAIVAGEAVSLPSRVLLDRPVPGPRADDPSLEPWRRSPSVASDLTGSVSRWRGGKREASDD